MKTRNTLVALLLLTMFTVASCATAIGPPVVEEEEERIERMEKEEGLPHFDLERYYG